MSLINFGKKKEETKKSACTCDGNCHTTEATEFTNFCCSEAKDKTCCIKVLGAGCSSCHKQYENTKKAIENLGFDIKVEYITDLQKVMEYGVMSMPALVINDKVVSMGKVLKVQEIETLFHKLGF